MNTRIMAIGMRAAALALVAALGACATAADPGAMTVATPQAATAPFPAALQHAMCVRDVTGGEDTNPLWVSKVDDQGFKAALSSSLDSAGLSAGSGTCVYPVDVHLLGLSQPSVGFDMTVTSHVNYKVYDASGQPFVLATIDAPYTATVSDAFVGMERLKLANEGSIRTSIQMFFDKLRESRPK
ncbi:MAG TPA: hypothetical protein VHU87_03190 [Rhizomicrobium sp.]|nr:hypothetical protein [Rhizomicrobium sp.]